MFESLKQWDRDLFVFLNGLGGEAFDSFWLFTTRIEIWIPLFIFFVYLIFYYYKGRKALVTLTFLIITFAVTYLFTLIVKDYVGRLRPNNVKAFAELIRILQEPNSYSFFSGHASSSFAITTFVVLMLRNYTKWIYLAYIWPIIFVLSRIFVGVHYPSDIFVGAIVGIVFAFVFHNLCKKVIEKESLFLHS
ncbi:phosphatase PAP2 family protein [Aequorivita sediminis]|uniref:phosphatase PAP2 family protein n=1 Tax=Aequorivita sediminis TaxID=3073653 RepID=UPI0028AC79CA|nr:phosphatase PAP2 family protein [Aequorivita sp. F6058]